MNEYEANYAVWQPRIGIRSFCAARSGQTTYIKSACNDFKNDVITLFYLAAYL